MPDVSYDEDRRRSTYGVFAKYTPKAITQVYPVRDTNGRHLGSFVVTMIRSKNPVSFVDRDHTIKNGD